jgi:hypothetical protein
MNDPHGLKGAGIASFAKHPEQSVLLACARYLLDPSAAEDLRQALAQEWEGHALIALAHWHRLLPCVQAALTAVGPDSVPAGLRAELRAQLHAITARQLLLTEELLRLLACFEAERLPVLPFKGPAFAALLEGQALPRPFADLDLLMHEHDVPRAGEVLGARGYHSRLRLDWQHSFVHDPTRMLVDLHWAFAPPTFYLPLSFEEVFTRQVTVAVGGRSIRTLSREDALLVLCVNAAKDGWGPLSRLYEIARFAQLRGLDWPGLLTTARRLRCERVLLMGLRLAQELLGGTLPAPIRERTLQDRAVRRLTAEILHRTLWRDRPGPFAQVCFGLKTREGLRAKLPYGRRLVGLLLEHMRPRRRAPSST